MKTKTLGLFKEFYKNELYDTIQELHLESQDLLEKESKAPKKDPRIKKLRRRIILFSIPIVLILLFTIPFLIFFYLIACYLVIKIGGRMGVSKMGEFRKKYKTLVIKKIIEFFGYEFDYKPFDSVSKEQVNNSTQVSHPN